MAAPMRLADLLASVSLLSDLGFALPPEESMRSCIIATALARRIGLAEADVSDVFYTALLQHLGCTGFAHETAAVFGNELVVNAAAARMDSDDVGDVVAFIRAATRSKGLAGRARVIAYAVVRGSAWGRRFATARCEVGRETARRLGLSEGVRRGLHEAAESWNGKEGVRGMRGEAISVAARIATLAATASRFLDIGGEEAVIDALRHRSGTALDPSMVSLFIEHASEILSEAGNGDPRDVLLAAEPAPVRVVSEAHLADVAVAIADVADLKSVFTLGHSSQVAALATGGATGLRLDEAASSRLRVAALLHDLGRVGISTSTWERVAPLTAAEWEQVRLHAYHSERILAQSEVLRPMAIIAGMHHERLDGSGYHRGSRGREIPVGARILAAADAFQAMTQERPHRGAIAPEQAAEHLNDDVRAGRLDGDATRAVIDAAGIKLHGRIRGAAPAGLSEREIEILRLVARGLSNREIASRLVVSPRTAEHHVQHIYTKIGTSSRAAAALFAMEHDVL